MGRLVLVLSAVPGSEEQQGVGRSAGREGVDAGRLVRGRGGARRAAPALRPLLAQGPFRPRLREHDRTVPKTGQPGDDPRRDGVHGLPDRSRRLAELGRRDQRCRRQTGVEKDRANASDSETRSQRCRETRRRVRAQGRPDNQGRQPRLQNVEKPRQRGQSRRSGPGIRGRRPAALRNVHGPARGREAVEHGRRQRRPRLPGSRVADDPRRPGRGGATPCGRAGRRALGRAEPHVAQDDQGGYGRPGADVVQHGHRPDDGVHELLPQVGAAAAGGHGKAGVVALAAGAARGRGTVASARPRPNAGLRALAHLRRGGPAGRHHRGAGADQRQASRAGSSSGRGRQSRAGSRPPAATRKSPNSWPARRSSRRSSCRGGW